MLKALLKFLGPWLLEQLIPVLDPEAAARAQALAAKIEEIEKREKEAEDRQRESDEFMRASELLYAESERKRRELDARLEESGRLRAIDEATLRESEARREVIRDETAKANSAIDARTDDDLLSGGVPKSTGPAGR
jgi:membrane protein involved in colicin uptake